MVPTVILAIDPGPTMSAWCHYAPGVSPTGDIMPNEELLKSLRTHPGEHLAIEMVQSFGMPVGRETFETCFWAGRLVEAWGKPYTLVYRQEVKLTLCHSAKAKDSNVRRALMDRLGEPGTKKAPGGTYGIKSHVWSALAVAVTWTERYAKEQAA